MQMKRDLNKRISDSSTTLLSLAQCLGLGLLGLLTIVAMGQEVFSIIAK